MIKRVAVVLDSQNLSSLSAALKILKDPLKSLVAPKQTENEKNYIIQDSGAELLNVHGIFDKYSDDLTPFRPASGGQEKLIIYTSGTTGKPKGVVHSGDSLNAQISTLIQEWRWISRDRILHSLPLNHIHGLVNAFLCPLAVGASVEFMPFEPRKTLERLFAANTSNNPISVYMAVPTMYAKLYKEFQCSPDSTRQRWRAAMPTSKLRLLVSGSAPLSKSLLNNWYTDIWGSDERGLLLERYGMTEIGMALGNPIDGPRIPGTVGKPYKGVEYRIVDQNGSIIRGIEEPGELLIKSPMMFTKYLNREKETTDSFTAGGFFCTGDVAQRVTVGTNQSDSYVQILGRKSVDIIKSKGYKISALEIEQELCENPQIEDACVVGLPDATLGEVVVALVVARSTAKIDEDSLRQWCKQRLSSYKVPQRFHFCDSIPRNKMGKSNKRKVIESFQKCI